MKTEECDKCVLYAKTLIIKRGDKRSCVVQSRSLISHHLVVFLV